MLKWKVLQTRRKIDIEMQNENANDKSLNGKFDILHAIKVKNENERLTFYLTSPGPQLRRISPLPDLTSTEPNHHHRNPPSHPPSNPTRPTALKFLKGFIIVY